MKKFFLEIIPYPFQNMIITLYNYIQYKKRYGGDYLKYFDIYNKNRNLSLDELYKIQNEKFLSFIDISLRGSPFFANLYKEINLPKSVNEIRKLPLLTKEQLQKNIDAIVTIPAKNGIKMKTGGTTGKSLEVLFTPNNMQERFALLDNFRSQFGYKLRRKTAWFSGKSLLTKRDLNNNRYWKTDYYYKIRYYSTFHMNNMYLKYYVEDLINYKPEYLVGFPSTMLEIAKYGLYHGYNFPVNIIKAIFPTAETLTSEMRLTIEAFFKAKMYDQYASSEGAPFIFECVNGNLHVELQSGVFEVLNDDDKPANTGRLIVTSFTTEGTPLIRYDIGDVITLENIEKKCMCGNNNPLVKEILGRIDDYVFSPETGKINMGNISNTLKGTKGIIRFQVKQDDLDQLNILLVIDEKIYDKKVEKIFIQNWRERVGSMILTVEYVNEIPVEKSGKCRLVKNNIKHLLQ